MKHNLKYALLIVIVLSLAFPLVALASAPGQETTTNWADLTSVLTWLVGAGSVYLAGYAVSLLAQNFQWFVNLPSTVKFLIPLLISVGISIGAQALLSSQIFLSTVSPYFTVIALAVLNWLGSQQGYMKLKAADYGRAKVVKS